MIEIERTINSTGLFGSLRRMGATGLAILQNRLELAAIEFKEEKSRLIAMAGWGAAAIFFGFMSIVALMFTLIFAFWDQRLAIMGGFLAFFLIGAITAFFMLKNKIRTPPFAETVNQLKKDQEWLRR